MGIEFSKNDVETLSESKETPLIRLPISSIALSFHFSLYPCSLRFPVRSSCIMPAIIDRFFSISTSNSATNASASDNADAIRCCSALS